PFSPHLVTTLFLHQSKEERHEAEIYFANHCAWIVRGARTRCFDSVGRDAIESGRRVGHAKCCEGKCDAAQRSASSSLASSPLARTSLLSWPARALLSGVALWPLGAALPS